MADRPDLPKIKPEGQPSIFNHDMGKWGVLTGLATIIPVSIAHRGRTTVNKTVALTGIAVEAAGALLGGLAGKQKQEQEMTEGRVVKTPGYWNKGILSGWLASGVMHLPFTISAWNKPPQMPSGGKALASAGVWVGSMVVGSVMRKNDLQRDFDRSIAVRDEQTNALQSQLRAAAIANGTPNFKNSVSADEAMDLAAKQERKEPHTSHTSHASHGEHAEHASHAEHHAQHASHAEKLHHAAAEADLAEAAR